MKYRIDYIKYKRVYKYKRVSTPAGKAGKAGNAGKAGKWAFFRIWLGKLENHRFFSCFGWKIRHFSLGLIIIKALLDKKRSYRETGLKKKRLFNITWDRPFSPSLPTIGSFHVLPEWLVGPYPPGLAYPETLILYRKFKFIGNFKVIQYYVTIVGPHCR